MDDCVNEYLRRNLNGYQHLGAFHLAYDNDERGSLRKNYLLG